MRSVNPVMPCLSPKGKCYVCKHAAPAVLQSAVLLGPVPYVRARTAAARAAAAIACCPQGDDGAQCLVAHGRPRRPVHRERDDDGQNYRHLHELVSALGFAFSERTLMGCAETQPPASAQCLQG